MCGIVAYTGQNSARAAVLAGLERMEYRGYDSAGVGFVNAAGHVDRYRAVGGVAALAEQVTAAASPADGLVGIGHTRWATHGQVTVANAHPFIGCGGQLLVALNGVIENHDALRNELTAAGHVFESETDAEVVAHLLESVDASDLAVGVAAVARRLRGHFAFVVAHRDRPDTVVGHRNRCPLVVLTTAGSSCLASSAIAAGAGLQTIMSLEDGDTVEATLDRVAVTDAAGRSATRPTRVADAAAEAAEAAIGEHESYMHKEMLQQPDAIASTIRSAGRDVNAILERSVREIVLTGCGTSLNAALLGRMMIEAWAGIPCVVEGATEWPTHRSFGPDALVLGLTQSGETADTIEALSQARAQGAQTCVITNTADSLAAREADLVIETATGHEVGVAATKTFVAQITALAVFALRVGAARGALTPAAEAALADELSTVPSLLDHTLELDGHIKRVAKLLADAPYALYLGRGATLPVALEGALKIKEIAYLPVESCSAGEMKHGPIALVDQSVPVVMLAPEGPTYEQTLTNMHEIAARGGQIIAVVTEGDDRVGTLASEIIEIPACDPLIAPLVCAVPLQLLAYHAARHRGLDPDRPRNLAKTVTVQ